jgi:lipopolysaccharide export system protein LptA
MLAVPLQADQARMMSDMQSKLAGPGERLRMSTGPFPNGDPSLVEMTVDPETGEERQTARGSIKLLIYPSAEAEEPRLSLDCLELDYVPSRGFMEASGNVVFMQEGIDARADEMVYDIDGGIITMRGTPVVDQKTGERNARFEGMEVFTVTTMEDESKAVTMRGPDEIQILMTSADPATGEFVVPAATEEGAAEEEAATGSMALGDEVDIRVAPRGDKEPIVDAEILPSGELGMFRGEGSVRLSTEELDLRSDELLYNAVSQRLEATTNVFFKKDTLEADAGRLDYDFEAGRIVLTVNPDVRQFDEAKVVRIWDNDWFIINLRDGGGYDISYGSTSRTGQTEIIDLKEYETAGSQQSETAVATPTPAPLATPKPVLTEVDPARPIIKETVIPKPTPRPKPKTR